MRYLLTIALALLGTAATRAQSPALSSLSATLHTVADTTHATVGLAIIDVETGDTLTIGNTHHYPMQSTYKFPQALAILHMADEGSLKLTNTVYIPASTLDTVTWSPMLKDHPDQGFFALSVQELLAYSVGLSDNNACDLLFKEAGGTQEVNRYIHSLGIEDMDIAATEAEVAKDWHLAYNNRSTPMAMAQLLQRFYEGKLLSKANTALLMDMMTATPSGPNRIKGLLPKAALVAHKTGSSGTNDEGVTAATNDVGIVTTPNGRHFAIVAFISDHKGTTAYGELIIAQLSRIAWDHFSR